MLRNESRIGGVFLGCLLVCPLIILGGATLYKDIQFGIHCGGHLKRAADANTVQLAKSELEYALNYMDANRMTQGTTSILWETPANDVGFWYKNVFESYQELQKITDQTDQMTKTNTLMKLRETLLDHGDSGDSVTHPGGISLFPNNALFCFLFVGFICISLIGFFIVMVALY